MSDAVALDECTQVVSAGAGARFLASVLRVASSQHRYIH